jgi:hypothetical protein
MCSSEVNLAFDLDSGELESVSDSVSGSAVQHQPGDLFQTQHYLVGADHDISAETGTLLIFDEAGQLSLEERPLPDAKYQIRLRTALIDLENDYQEHLFTVNNSTLINDQRVFIHPIYGYQFRLPEKWTEPEIGERQLTVKDPDSSVGITISSQPGMSGISGSDFRDQVFEAFGSIQELYEEPAAVGDISTTWTAYGYESSEGSHTGVFIAFAAGDWGHVVDIEGLSADEESLLQTAGLLVNSLVVRKIDRNDGQGRWTEVAGDGFSISADSTFLYYLLDSGWYRFIGKDGDSFIAFKVLPPNEGSDAKLLERWLHTAAEGGTFFAHSAPYQAQLGEETWLRSDFSYTNPDDEEILGFFMSADSSAKNLIVWAEAPAEAYDSIDMEMFLPMLFDVKTAN